MSLEGTTGGFDDGNGKVRKKSVQERTEKPKRELQTYKYSKMGQEDLHESIILDGAPVFIRYDIENKQIKIVNRIEQQTRILIPPSHEEYPYAPYEFTKRELDEYVRLSNAESRCAKRHIL